MLAPTQTPPIKWMLEDIPHTDRQIAKYLGVSVRTVQRYRKTNNAPLAVYRALFWETRWGRSAVHAKAQNDADMWQQYANALERQNVALVAHIKLLESPGNDLAANAPKFKIG